MPTAIMMLNPIPVITHPTSKSGPICVDSSLQMHQQWSNLKNNINHYLQPGKQCTPNVDDGHNGDSNSMRGGEALSMKQSLTKL